ncbi:MAG: hypothetical protein QXK12_08645 [Candidatus Nezhaarchaeales archaeon]
MSYPYVNPYTVKTYKVKKVGSGTMHDPVTFDLTGINVPEGYAVQVLKEYPDGFEIEVRELPETAGKRFQIDKAGKRVFI